MITSTKLREELKKVCPKLKFIVLTDPQWHSITLQDFLLEKQSQQIIDFADNVFGCEEYAMKFVVDYRIEERIKLRSLNAPLGFVHGTKYKGKEINHSWNIVYTEDKGFVCFEPQLNNDYWIASNKTDNIYFAHF